MNKFTRSRRAVWGDTRFLIGILLVVLSIGGVWLTLSSSGTTTPVLQANRTIVRGEALVSADFHVVEVNLGAVSDRYLAPQDLRPGLIASRTVSDGELVSTVAAEDAEENRSTTIVIETTTDIPSNVAAGSLVELWNSPPGKREGTLDRPRILLAEAIVTSVEKSEGMLSGGGVSVQIVIDRAEVANVLAAITDESVLSIVPIGSRQ